MILNEGSGRAAELFSRRRKPGGRAPGTGCGMTRRFFGSWVDWGKNPLNFMGKYWNMFNNSYNW